MNDWNYSACPVEPGKYETKKLDGDESWTMHWDGYKWATWPMDFGAPKLLWRNIP